MINIIDHFWQFELKNYHILPTLIKFVNNQPKSYFYSEKQKRILRKKDQSVASTLEFIGNSASQNQNYLLVMQRSANQVQLSLCLMCQIEEHLNNNSKNLAIIQLNQQHSSTFIINCCLDAQGTVSIKPLMAYDKGRSLWSCNVEQIDITPQQMKAYMINTRKDLSIALKVKSKCRKIDVILSVTPAIKVAHLLWCNKLSFQGKQFYEIDYSFQVKSNEPHLNKKEQSSKIQTRQIPQKLEIRHNIEIQPECRQASSPLQINKTAQKVIRCNGCGGDTNEQNCKQAQNSDVISLRRRKGLSILGIKQQYLAVCEGCYYAIDE